MQAVSIFTEYYCAWWK